jgi:hypothetical protein
LPAPYPNARKSPRRSRISWRGCARSTATRSYRLVAPTLCQPIGVAVEGLRGHQFFLYHCTASSTLTWLSQGAHAASAIGSTSNGGRLLNCSPQAELTIFDSGLDSEPTQPSFKRLMVRSATSLLTRKAIMSAPNGHSNGSAIASASSNALENVALVPAANFSIGPLSRQSR